MADDTRDSTTSTTTPEVAEYPQDSSKPKPKHDFGKTQVGKLWDAFGGPEDQANMLSTTKSSGNGDGSTVSNAMKSMSLKDATSFYKAPCARDSLLLGIGAGFGVGGVRGILGGKEIIQTPHICRYVKFHWWLTLPPA